MFPLVSNAQCSYERQAELSKIASNVQFSYTYDFQINEDGERIPKFSVFINNITRDIYIIEDYNGLVINSMDEKKIDYTGIPSVQFTIYSNDPNCKGEKLLVKNVNMPVYNQFSHSEECQKNPTFKFCQLWGDKPLNTEDFNTELNQKINETKEENYSDIGVYEKILNFISDNKLSLILVVLSLLFIIIYFTLIKKHIYRRN